MLDECRREQSHVHFSPRRISHIFPVHVSILSSVRTRDCAVIAAPRGRSRVRQSSQVVKVCHTHRIRIATMLYEISNDHLDSCSVVESGLCYSEGCQSVDRCERLAVIGRGRRRRPTPGTATGQLAQLARLARPAPSPNSMHLTIDTPYWRRYSVLGCPSFFTCMEGRVPLRYGVGRVRQRAMIGLRREWPSHLSTVPEWGRSTEDAWSLCWPALLALLAGMWPIWDVSDMRGVCN